MVRLDGAQRIAAGYSGVKLGAAAGSASVQVRSGGEASLEDGVRGAARKAVDTIVPFAGTGMDALSERFEDTSSAQPEDRDGAFNTDMEPEVDEIEYYQ